MAASADSKICVACGKLLKGRIDKKFCDDNCRNSYNNQQKAKGSYSAYVRTINNTLIKNRRILESLLPKGAESLFASRWHRRMRRELGR